MDIYYLVLVLSLLFIVYMAALESVRHDSPQHLTAVLHQATIQLVRCISLCTGIYAEKCQPEAVHTLCGLLRIIVQAGTLGTCSK